MTTSYIALLFIMIILSIAAVAYCIKSTKNTVNIIHYSKCKIKFCRSMHYAEMGIYTYATTIQVGNNECTSNSYDVFRACRKYKKDTVVCDIDVKILVDGTSKIIIKSIAETTLDKEEILNGKFNSSRE